jgi:hypothetical protein
MKGDEFFGGFHIFWELKGDHWIDFRIYEVAGETDQGAPLYPTGDGDFVEDTDTAEELGHGHIKWDGCSDWDFNTDDCMKHFCGREDVQRFGRMMEHLYDIAAEKMPSYNKEVGG